MERNHRILQLTAIGDAMGAGYEYAPQDEVSNFRLDWGFRDHPLYSEDIKAGQWTDDTMLSFAAARGIIEGTKDHRIAMSEQLAFEMISLHEKYPTKGYSKGMLAALEKFKTPNDLRMGFIDHGRSESNGSAMRAAVYGVMPDPFATVERCSQLTHTGEGVEGAVVVATIVHHFIHHEDSEKKYLNQFIEREVNPLYTTRMRERVTKQNGPLTFLTVCAALTAIRESETLTEVLEKSIRVGGDVDTVAAIAMAIASTIKEITDDLPTWVYEGIKPVAGLTWNDLVETDRILTQVAEC